MEQKRIVPSEEADYQPKSNELAAEAEVLSENGAKAKESLSQVIEIYRQTNPKLVDLLLGEIEKYPVGLFNQLGRVMEKPIFKAQDGQRGHWAYELTMVERTVACAERLQSLLEGTGRSIADLVFMIVIGDIGKAGPVLSDDLAESAVVSRIYNQAIFHQAHQRWLVSCDPDSFPEELDTAMAQIDKSEPKDGGLSSWDLVFKNGTFIGIPIEVYMYVLKQVALQKLDGEADLVERLFSLSPAEKGFLRLQGFDPTTTPIRKFFTSSHIKFGYEFLSVEGRLGDEKSELVGLALSHHLSQGELPPNLDFSTIVGDESKMKICAYLEILDKVDAIFHRGTPQVASDDASAKSRAIESAISITQTEIKSNLQRNYSQYPQLVEIYEKVLKAMRDAGVFNFA